MGDDTLDAQAHSRLMAHLHNTTTPHIFPDDDDDDKIEEAPMEEKHYTPAMEAVFSSLLQAIDKTSNELSHDLCRAITSLCLIFLLPTFGPITFSISKVYLVPGIVTSARALSPLRRRPGVVLAAFLKRLAQTIVNIVSPQNAEDPPPFLDNTLYTQEFWHFHLNYGYQHFHNKHNGPERLQSLLGDSENFQNKGKLDWSLRFPLSAPTKSVKAAHRNFL